jgi:undecaprenyl-diphosphatase
VDYWTAIILALVQGLTEFLPISSSAHLILLPLLMGWEDQGLAFDVAVHLGTLVAVVWCFRTEIAEVVKGWLLAVTGRPHVQRDARLGWNILIGTIPLVVAGYLFQDLIAHQLRSPLVIAVDTAVFGVLLWVADLRSHPVRDEHDIGIKIALLIGCAQALALIPGTSRSGITMTAALALGLSRESAARFSFLLAVPAIFAASVLEVSDLLTMTEPVNWRFMAVGIVVSTVSAYCCIKVFLAVIQRLGMLPFMIYRLLLAAVIVLLIM